MIDPHFYVETDPYKGCGQCGIGPGAAHHNSHEVRRYKEKKGMKIVQIEISSARSLEHAMDQALEYADNDCYSKEAGRGDQTHTVTKVVFKTLECCPSYREKTFTYKFEAELAEC